MPTIASGFRPRLHHRIPVSHEEVVEFLRIPTESRPGHLTEVKRSAFWLGDLVWLGERPVVAVAVPIRLKINGSGTEWYFGTLPDWRLRDVPRPQAVALCLEAAQFPAPNPAMAVETVARFLDPNIELEVRAIEETSAYG